MRQNLAWSKKACSILLMAAAPALAFAGCMSTEQLDKLAPGNASKQVKVGGSGVQLGDAQQPGITTDAFVRRLQEMLAEQKLASAHHLVQRFPDVSLEILRNSVGPQAPNPTVQALAEIYDQECCRVDPKAGWAELFKDCGQHPELYSAYDAARKQLQDHLRAGHVKQAADMHLLATARAAPGVVLQLDALQRSAEALLRADRPQEATSTIAQACQLAGAAFPHQFVTLLLILSDAQRRAGHEDKAVAAWQDAAELATTLLHPAHPLADPALWERVAYMRPVSSAWPNAVAQQLQGRPEDNAKAQIIPAVAKTSKIPVIAGQAAASEAQIWAAIAQWRLRRGEAQGALVAFKHAESFALEQPIRDPLQLGEAQALAQLGQRASALGILTRLTENPNPEVAQPALAVLGSLLFNDGQVSEAQASLRKAVGPDSAKVWPGRAKAEADLGLACLTTGAEAEGLAHLHNAQKHFAAQGEFELLQQCFWNEAQYLDHTSKPAEAGAVRQQMRQLETGPH